MPDIDFGPVYMHFSEELAALDLDEKQREIIKVEVVREKVKVGKKFFFFDAYENFETLRFIVLDEAEYVARLLLGEIDSLEDSIRYSSIYDKIEIQFYQNGVLVNEKQLQVG